MLKLMHKLLSIFTLAALLGQAANAAAADQELREAIEAVEQKWVEAWNSRDVEAYANLYAEDAQQMNPDSKVVKGREAIRSRFEDFVKEAGDKVQKVTTVDVIGQGQYATETGLWVEQSELESFQREGTYIMVWKKAGDSWKVHREIWNETSEKYTLIEPLLPLERLLGTWMAEIKAGDSQVTILLTSKAGAGGGTILGHGEVRVNGVLASQWSDLTYYRPESKTIVGVVASKTEGHASATIHPLEDKVVYQESGFDGEGKPESRVNEIVFLEDGRIRFSQISAFLDGRAKGELTKDVVFKRQ